MSTTEVITQTEASRTYLFHEYYDAEVMDQLLAHPEGYAKRDIQMLGRYRKARKQGNHVEVHYERSGKIAQQKQLGRLYPRGGLGLQSFSFDIRNPLLAKYYFDCDMVNAHYTLLLAFAQRWGLKCVAIEQYINNRDVELAKVSANRGIAKVAFLKVAYGGNIKLAFEFYNEEGISPEGDMTLLKEIESEMKHIVEYCWKENKDLHRMCSSKDHPKFSCFAYVLQTEECKCLLEIVNYMMSVGREVGVLIHDGCCIKKKENETLLSAELLRGAEAWVKDKTGYDIQLVIKPWKHDFKTKDEEHPVLSGDIVVDDAYAARRFCEFMGDLFVMDSGELWVFNEETGMWSSEKSALERVITTLNGKLVFRQLGPLGVKTFDYSGSVEKRSALVKMLPAVAPVKDGYFRSRISSDRNKLLFKDGIYDFTTRTFTPAFDPNIVFHKSCPRKFPSDKEAEKVAFIQKVCFEEPFKDIREAKRIRHNLMRAMIGDWRRKKCVTALGPKNSGKSILIFLMRTAFGDYVGTFDANSMLIRHGGEAGRDMLWIHDIYNCRFAFSSEIKQDDSSKMPSIDGNMLKKLVGGGDELQFRKMCANGQTKVFFTATMFIMANDFPKIVPCSEEIKDRLEVVDYHYSFQSHPTELHHKPVDKKIGDLFSQDDYGDAMFWLLTEEYEQWEAEGFPELPPCENEVQEDMMEQVDVKNVLLGEFELTGKDEDNVEAKDVQTYLRRNGFVGSETKITREMKQLGLGTARVQKARQRVKVYTGIRRPSPL